MLIIIGMVSPVPCGNSLFCSFVFDLAVLITLVFVSVAMCVWTSFDTAVLFFDCLALVWVIIILSNSWQVELSILLEVCFPLLVGGVWSGLLSAVETFIFCTTVSLLSLCMWLFWTFYGMQFLVVFRVSDPQQILIQALNMTSGVQLQHT